MTEAATRVDIERSSDTALDTAIDVGIAWKAALEDRNAGETPERAVAANGAGRQGSLGQTALQPGRSDGAGGKVQAVGRAGDRQSEIVVNDDADMDADLQRELEQLALSSSITELGWHIEAAFTLIFEVQEQRHLANAADGQGDAKNKAGDSSQASSAISAVDAALIRLDAQLEQTGNEVASLQARLDAVWKQGDDSFLRQKWQESLARWQQAVRETESMREELVEDKYLTVYRTVSKQAEDMMQSLEKVFNQCTTFVHEMHGKYGSGKGSASSSASSDLTSEGEAYSLQAHLNTFLALNKSLHQKSKYYLPSCERVLKVIDSGIAQQKSLNGEVLHSHSGMKLRWRNLKERMARVEQEMTSVQDLLSEMSEKSQATSAQSTAWSASKSRNRMSGFFGGSPKDGTGTPSRASGFASRSGTGAHLTPSPPVGQKASPGNGRISPFRKLTSRLRSSREGNVPPLPSAGQHGSPSGRLSPTSTSSSSISSIAQQPYARQYQNTTAQARVGPTAYSGRPSLPSQYTSLQQLPPDRFGQGGSAGRPASRGPPSTAGSASASRPAWNASTKPPKEAPLPSLASSLPPSNGPRPRQSMLFGTPSRAMSPAFGSATVSGRRTPGAYPSRPASRHFSAPLALPSMRQSRPASPAMSATSNMSASIVRARPSSPDSRIPAPASALHLTQGSPLKAQSRRSSSALGISAPANATPTRKGARTSLAAYGTPSRQNARNGAAEDEATETLFFESGEPTDDMGSSMISRAMSPAPSLGGISGVSSSALRRQSFIPRLNVSTSSQPGTPLSSPCNLSKFVGSASTNGSGFAYDRANLQTPEPMLRTRAARASAIYGAGKRDSLGLPGPPSSAGYSGTRQNKSSTATSATLRSTLRSDSGTASPSRRPLSPLQYQNNRSASASRRSSLSTGVGRSRPGAPSELSFDASLADLEGLSIAEEEEDFGPYRPNPIDPLDVEVAAVVNSQPAYIMCMRYDLPLNKAGALAQKASERTARYIFGAGAQQQGREEKPLSCKLVERQGRESKVLVRVGGVWQDLRMYLLDQQAQY